MESVDAACASSLVYEIPTIRPAYIRQHYRHRTRAVSMMPWSLSVKMLGVPTYCSILRTDLTLIFDAILFDRSLYNPLFNFMSSLYLLLPSARRKGKKMACFNIGAGPVNTRHGRHMLRVIAEMMDFITVRDRESYAILRDIGVENPNILLTADAALNVKASEPEKADAMLRSLDLDPGEDILGINVNAYIDTWAGPHVKPMGKEKFLSTYAGALSRVLAELRVPVLFVCTQHLDVPITRELMDRVETPGRKAILTNVEHDHYDIKAALGKLAMLFGMRLHCMILASSELTPIIGLAYQPKVHAYYESLGIAQHSLDFEHFSEDALVQHLRRGWDQRTAIHSQLSRRVPELQREARKAADLVGALHRDEDIGAVVAGLGG